MTFTGGTRLVLSILEIYSIDTCFRKMGEGLVDSIHLFGYRCRRHYRLSCMNSKAVNTLSIAQAILEASQILRKAGIPEPRREAGSLLAHVIDKDRTFLISHAEDHLAVEEFQRFSNWIRRRALGAPLQYITGRQDFYGREFIVTPAQHLSIDDTSVDVVMFRSNGYTDLEKRAIAAVSRAAPYPAPDPSLLAGQASLTFLESFLFRDDGRFQVRTVAEEQSTGLEPRPRKPAKK